MILIILLYALLALTFPLGQLAVAAADPSVVIAVRMIIAGVLLLGSYWICCKKPVIHARDRFLFFKVALFHIYLAFVPEFWSLQFLSPLKVNLMFSATPFINAFFEYILHNRRFAWQQYVGIIIGVAGALLPLLATATQHCVPRICLIPYLPEAALMVAVVSSSYAWFVVRELMNRGYALVHINGSAMLMGGLLSAATAPFIHLGLYVTHVPQLVLTVAALIIISNGIAYQLHGTLLKYYSPTFLGFCGFLCPLFGAFYARVFFNEPLTWHIFAALLLIGIGLWLFTKGDAHKR